MKYAQLDIIQLWQKNPDNPLFNTVGEAGSWNSDPTPFVLGHAIWDETHYKLYISGNHGEHHSIGLVTSTDLESGWEFHENNPVLTVGAPGSWDDDEVFGAMVIKDGDVYKMWYNGEGLGDTVCIGYATSPDGINWTKDTENNPVLTPVAENFWETVEVFSPYVIKEDDEYKMWYTGGNGSHQRIGYATSQDGINWTRYSNMPVLGIDWPDMEAVNAPVVYAFDNAYMMWYNNWYNYQNKIGFALSEDGIDWIKDWNSPVLPLGETGEWDSGMTTVLQVFKEDTTVKMLYFGSDWEDNYGVGLATLVAMISTYADLEVSPEIIEENLYTGQFADHTISIQNNGGATLNFDISIFSHWGAGSENYALHFDGTDDYINVNVPGTHEQMTVSMWFKDYGGNYNTLLKSQQQNPAGCPVIMFLGDENKLIFESDKGDVEFIIQSMTSFETDKWYHVAATYDNTNDVAKIYINGKLEAELSGTPGPAEIGNALIGGLTEWSGWFFNGVIDEVRLWNVIRTEEEIKADMHHQISGDEPGLIGYWPFNEGEGGTTFDQTSSNYNGSLNGDVTWIRQNTRLLPN